MVYIQEVFHHLFHNNIALPTAAECRRPGFIYDCITSQPMRENVAFRLRLNFEDGITRYSIKMKRKVVSCIDINYDCTKSGVENQLWQDLVKWSTDVFTTSIHLPVFPGTAHVNFPAHSLVSLLG